MTSKTLFTAALLALSLTACGTKKAALQSFEASSSSTSIVNGQEVAAEDVLTKSTVALLISLEGYPEVMICTGTLVAKNVVITAAHCLEDYVDFFFNGETGKYEKVVIPVVGGSVIFGTQARVEGAVKRNITKWKINPDYSPKEKGQGDWDDIAVLQFDGEVPAGYDTVPYLQETAPLVKDLAVVFAGYGITSPEGGNTPESDPRGNDSGILRKVEITLTSAEHEGNELLFELPKTGASTCQGDSGGPAYATISGQLTLIGVTSRGEDAACKGVSISTSTAAHAEFLKTTIQELSL